MALALAGLVLALAGLIIAGVSLLRHPENRWRTRSFFLATACVLVAAGCFAVSVLTANA